MNKKDKRIKPLPSTPVLGKDDEGNLYYDADYNENSDIDKNLLELENKTESKLAKDYEFLNRELEIRNNKIKSLMKRVKFKLGDLFDEDIEKIADQTRKKNGKINYTAMGKRLGVSRETVKREIGKRKLAYLIDSSSI